jgi:hypothetical protein
MLVATPFVGAVATLHEVTPPMSAIAIHFMIFSADEFANRGARDGTNSLASPRPRSARSTIHAATTLHDSRSFATTTELNAHDVDDNWSASSIADASESRRSPPFLRLIHRSISRGDGRHS